MAKPTPLSIALAVLLAASPPSLAQELTLDSFDLGGEQKTDGKVQPSAPESEIETCLLDPSACQNAEYRSGSSLSIDDVVNLGVIDRENIATTQTNSTGRMEPVNTAESLPSIDMEILFDYNSASIRADQAVRLAELSAVLRGAKFNDYTLAFIGHTDAVGSATYNQTLSQRRAEAVALFVSEAGSIPLTRTSATGLGYSRLKTPSDPTGAQNRRVQLVLIPR